MQLPKSYSGTLICDFGLGIPRYFLEPFSVQKPNLVAGTRTVTHKNADPSVLISGQHRACVSEMQKAVTKQEARTKAVYGAHKRIGFMRLCTSTHAPSRTLHLYLQALPILHGYSQDNWFIKLLSHFLFPWPLGFQSEPQQIYSAEGRVVSAQNEVTSSKLYPVCYDVICFQMTTFGITLHSILLHLVPADHTWHLADVLCIVSFWRNEASDKEGTKPPTVVYKGPALRSNQNGFSVHYKLEKCFIARVIEEVALFSAEADCPFCIIAETYL